MRNHIESRKKKILREIEYWISQERERKCQNFWNFLLGKFSRSFEIIRLCEIETRINGTISWNKLSKIYENLDVFRWKSNKKYGRFMMLSAFHSHIYSSHSLTQVALCNYISIGFASSWPCLYHIFIHYKHYWFVFMHSSVLNIWWWCLCRYIWDTLLSQYAWNSEETLRKDKKENNKKHTHSLYIGGCQNLNIDNNYKSNKL